MKPTRPALTNLPVAPDEERKHRMIKYTVAMGVRIVCVFAAILAPGWWAAAPILGAIFLPYFAVVLANVSADPRKGEVQRPGAILPVAPSPTGPRGERREDR
ncbi:conserved hypothetical protein [Leifsonia xyli subsp. xyli str. CTCB07]|uniref:DUF3099 domain-containing protein n=2 Tax=Leifsonia xyli subsp. xyli TaxID=59736 RepID=Q6AF24_LEIXX|nr:DUF3099 domain-containing protein [Leifsonia xyli]AAT89021.1 conserved hypothetical protein [Leifsonia xyli subsp. xyli str. CTCB07]